MKAVWYPYTQMKTQSPPYKVTSAKKCSLTLDDGSTLIDAISSWWCVIHGYNHPKLNKAITSQLKKMAHVMLGGLSHEPAEALAKKLVEITPEGLNHVFFSDSGSVGCEIAIKLAWQYYKNKKIPHKKAFIALKGAYHGDTTGVMSLADDDDSMHAAYQDLLRPAYHVTPENWDELETLLKNHHAEIAGFFIEPLMQGAGGFKLHSPEYVQKAHTLCKKYDVLFIADEVATGFGRLGSLFAMDQVELCPDILILGKGLTAGYLGMAATLTSSEVFNAFYDTDPKKAFMHGPTFMGNPLAAAVALKSIALFETENTLAKIKKIEAILTTEFKAFHHPKVKEVRIKGAMGCLEVWDESLLKNAQSYAKSEGVWLRPFGPYLYTMPPYCISKKELKKITDTMKKFLNI